MQPQVDSAVKEGTCTSSISESSGSDGEICDQERFLRACEEEEIVVMIELIESKAPTAVPASMIAGGTGPAGSLLNLKGKEQPLPPSRQ